MPNWKEANPDLVKEIVRKAEVYLQGQLTLATSADQRASVLGGIYAASGTAIVAGLIAAVANGFSAPGIMWGGVVAALFFLSGACLCLSTVLPIGFYLPGNQPSGWYDDIDQKREMKEALGEEAENMQGEIEFNRAAIETNARRFKWGAISGIAAPILGFLIWFINSIQWAPELATK